MKSIKVIVIGFILAICVAHGISLTFTVDYKDD